MHVCFFSMAKGWGGGELLLSYLLESIAELGVETSLISRHGSPMASWAKQRTALRHFEVLGHCLSRPACRQVRSWVRGNKPDVLVLNDPHAITQGGIAAWGLCIPRIGIRHTIFRVNALKHRWLTEHLVCVSEAARDACLAVGLPRAKTSVIHCGLPSPQVHAEQVAGIQEMFAVAVAAVNDSAPARHLLGVGSLISVKGFDATIRAVAKGVEKGKNWHLWLAGEGEKRTELEKLAVDLKIADRVHFLGFRNDIVTLMSAVDVFVSSSRSEGLPLVLVEAMQVGCPIASTPVGGCCEALRVNKNAQSPFAEIFAPDSIEDACAAIERATDQNPLTEGRRATARHWAVETFSQQNMAKKHLALYEEISSGHVA